MPCPVIGENYSPAQNYSPLFPYAIGGICAIRDFRPVTMAGLLTSGSADEPESACLPQADGADDPATPDPENSNGMQGASPSPV